MPPPEPRQVPQINQAVDATGENPNKKAMSTQKYPRVITTWRWIMASKVTKWVMDWITGIMTCTIEVVGKASTYDVKDIFPDWAELTDIQKHCIYTGLKPKLEDSTAKGKELKQTPMERYAAISNMWDRLTIDEVWTTKREREESIQKKLSNMKVISVSMAKAAPLLGLKVDPAAKILSDEEYAEHMTSINGEDSDD
jgi:hypothetical protein